MGMLRSALSAAIRAVERPAQALEVLGLYARSVEGALATTVVQAVVDTRSRLITYSSAGHPPPVLLHPDGTYELLDQATDPPLGARPEHVPRPQADLPYTPATPSCSTPTGSSNAAARTSTPVCDRLADALARHCRPRAPSAWPTPCWRDLGVSSGARDDIALIVIRLMTRTSPAEHHR